MIWEDFFFEKLATLAMYLVYFRLCYYMSWIVPCLIDLTLIMVHSKYLPWQFYTVITTKTLCYYWISVQVVHKEYLSDHLDLRRNKNARYLLQSLRLMIIKYPINYFTKKLRFSKFWGSIYCSTITKSTTYIYFGKRHTISLH